MLLPANQTYYFFKSSHVPLFSVYMYTYTMYIYRKENAMLCIESQNKSKLYVQEVSYIFV